MPKIGNALKRAVELKPEEGADDASRAKPASGLMNENRLRIFRFLCARPCADIGTISSNLSMSRSSVSWHMSRLMDAEYAAAFEDGGKAVFCPSGLISSQNIRLFAVLARDDCRAVYKAALAAEGSDREALSAAAGLRAQKTDKCIRALLDVGLLSRMRDGRHTRHFPTGRLAAAIAEERPAVKEFVRRLIRRLAAEHMHPDVTELKGGGIVIALNALGRTEKIEIPLRTAEI